MFVQERMSLCRGGATTAPHRHAGRKVRAGPESTGLEKPLGLGIPVITSLLCRFFCCFFLPQSLHHTNVHQLTSIQPVISPSFSHYRVEAWWPSRPPGRILVHQNLRGLVGEL